jgi:hypothetical protein
MQLTPKKQNLLEKLVVAHILKKYPAFYATLVFITVLIRIRHWPSYSQTD